MLQLNGKVSFWDLCIALTNIPTNEMLRFMLNVRHPQLQKKKSRPNKLWRKNLFGKTFCHNLEMIKYLMKLNSYFIHKDTMQMQMEIEWMKLKTKDFRNKSFALVEVQKRFSQKWGPFHCYSVCTSLARHPAIELIYRNEANVWLGLAQAIEWSFRAKILRFQSFEPFTFAKKSKKHNFHQYFILTYPWNA